MSVRRLTRGALANSVSLFARIVINFVLTPFLILHLGKGAYGVWMTLVTFTLSGSLSFFSFGFQGALIKYVAQFHAVKKYRELNEVFSATLKVYTTAGAVCGLVIAFGAQFFLVRMFNVPPDSVDSARAILYIFAAMIVVELPCLGISAVIEGLQRYDLLAVFDVGRLLVFAAGAWIATHSENVLFALALSMFASTVLYTLTLAIAARVLVPTLQLVRDGDRSTRSELYRLTRDLFLVRMNSLVYNNMDKMIIGVMLTTTEVTDYDIANRLHGLAITVMGLAPSVVLPASAAYDATSDEERQQQLLLKGSKYSTAMALPFVVSLFFLAGPLIRAWVDPQYGYVAGFAKVFLSYLLFWPVIQVGWNMLVGVNRVSSLVPLQTASVVLNLVVSIVLTGRIGVIGTMLGTVVANALIFIPYVRLILNTFKVSVGDFVRAVLPGYIVSAAGALLLAGILSVHTPASLREVALFLVGSVGTSYLVFFLFFVNANEKKQLLGIVRRVPKTA